MGHGDTSQHICNEWKRVISLGSSLGISIDNSSSKTNLSSARLRKMIPGYGVRFLPSYSDFHDKEGYSRCLSICGTSSRVPDPPVATSRSLAPPEEGEGNSEIACDDPASPRIPPGGCRLKYLALVFTSCENWSEFCCE